MAIQVAAPERLLAERRLRLVLTDAARDRLVDLGYEPALGARPLRREIARQGPDPLAEALLRGRFADGTTLTVDCDGEALTLVGGAVSA